MFKPYKLRTPGIEPVVRWWW